jgi:hypothetical protein
MRLTTRLLLLLTAGAPVVACFDFGKYSFPEAAPDGVGGECASNYCVDGNCCDGACGAACEACNTPGNPGYCQGIEVDDQCLTSQGCPVGSDCIKYGSGSSGACAGRGSCSASSGCTPTYSPLGTACAGGTGQCDGAGTCKGLLKDLGVACEAGAECTEGFCAATAAGAKVCCNQACDGVCEQCSALGQCNEAPEVDPLHCTPPRCPVDDVCRDYPPSPTAASCASFGTCVAEEACAPDALRPAGECTCGPNGCKLAQGAVCASPAQCASGFCNNGVCCDSACNDTCEQCNQDTGVCGSINGCECAPGQTTTCGARFNRQGDCAMRQITCNGAGQWPVAQCNAQGAELCNNDGRDEDCNGDPRNGCACLNGQLSDCTEQRRAQGVCARRSLTCTNGQWPVAQCNATSQEMCRNGLDDDCDGAVDENPPCAPQFDGNNCDFTRPSCEDLRCTQCGGCDACQQIIICVRDDQRGCATANDPVCRNSGCGAFVDEGDLNDFDGVTATEFAAAYIRCACTR